MQPDYSDILERIPEPPRWWFNGVPRYEAFSPRDMSVGTEEKALVRVRCQDCGTEFLVGLEPSWPWIAGGASMLERLAADDFNCDDPPRHGHPDGGRCAGETMGSVPVDLLEAWRRESATGDFVRQPQFEGAIVSGA